MKTHFKFLFWILLLFLGTKLTFAQQSEARSQFSVLNQGNTFYPNLKSSDIQITQDKEVMEIVSLESRSNMPLEIAVMIDTSASQENMLPNIKKITSYLVDNILDKNKDKIALVSFSNEVGLEQDLKSDFKLFKEKLETVKFIPPAGYIGGGIVAGKLPPKGAGSNTGATAVWDSVQKVIEVFSGVKKENSTHRIVILFSDGVDTFSEKKLEDVIDSSIEHQTPVYSIAIGDSYYGSIDKKKIRKLAEETGGIYVSPDKKLKNLPEITNLIKSNLQGLYEVIFKPKYKTKSGLQKFDVEIVNPELSKEKLKIIQPKSYFVKN